MFSRSTRLARPAYAFSRICTRSLSSHRVIFSGIQPTGTPHLGNYIGAVRRWVALQDEPAEQSDLLYSVVDLHAMTLPSAPEDLRRNRRESMASLLAAGIDPSRSALFYQSSVSPCQMTNIISRRYTANIFVTQVPAHSELMWILGCNASMGYLSRMTQWKVGCAEFLSR